MIKKLYPIKWYKRIQSGSFADWYCEYRKSVYRPDVDWWPCDDKYLKERERFKKVINKGT